MMKNKARFLCLLPVLLCLFGLVSCGEVKIVAEEGELLAAAESLLDRAGLWNELFYVKGIPTLGGGREFGKYREADPAYLEAIGMTSLADIKAYGATVFSPDMMEVYEQTLFGEAGIAACLDYSTLDETGNRQFICLAVNPEKNPALDADEVIYRSDSMHVTYNLNHRATVSVTVEGTGEKSGKTATVRINLVSVDGVWYLDNHTFAKLGE